MSGCGHLCTGVNFNTMPLTVFRFTRMFIIVYINRVFFSLSLSRFRPDSGLCCPILNILVKLNTVSGIVLKLTAVG